MELMLSGKSYNNRLKNWLIKIIKRHHKMEKEKNWPKKEVNQN
jgi:hypothetical protein